LGGGGKVCFWVEAYFVWGEGGAKKKQKKKKRGVASQGGQSFNIGEHHIAKISGKKLFISAKWFDYWALSKRKRRNGGPEEKAFSQKNGLSRDYQRGLGTTGKKKKKGATPRTATNKKKGPDQRDVPVGRPLTGGTSGADPGPNSRIGLQGGGCFDQEKTRPKGEGMPKVVRWPGKKGGTCRGREGRLSKKTVGGKYNIQRSSQKKKGEKDERRGCGKTRRPIKQRKQGKKRGGHRPPQKRSCRQERFTVRTNRTRTGWKPIKRPVPGGSKKDDHQAKISKSQGLGKPVCRQERDGPLPEGTKKTRDGRERSRSKKKGVIAPQENFAARGNMTGAYGVRQMKWGRVKKKRVGTVTKKGNAVRWPTKGICKPSTKHKGEPRGKRRQLFAARKGGRERLLICNKKKKSWCWFLVGGKNGPPTRGGGRRGGIAEKGKEAALP